MATNRNTAIKSDQVAKHTLIQEDISPSALSWQEPVEDKDLTAPPSSGLAEGDRYIVGTGATGAWTGEDDNIAQYVDSSWSFYTPLEGWFVWVKDEDTLYRYSGSAWAEFSAGGGDTLPIADTTGIAKGSVDATKIVRLEVDGLTTETTRVLTVQDKDYTIADNAEVTKAKKTTVGITIDGSGIELTSGYKGFIRVPYACTITAWTLLVDVSGSIKIDVWKDTFANYPPTDVDSITNGHEPEITSAIKAEDTDLSDWSSVSVTAGDILGFNVDSCTDITKVTLVLEVTKI